MDVIQINRSLSVGAYEEPGVLPKLDELRGKRFVFKPSFGLNQLPHDPGVILIRGARQYGKSTWLQQQVYSTVTDFGPGSAYLLNGDEIPNANALRQAIRELVPLFSTAAPARRLFIDEITAVKDWQTALKTLLDAGELRGVLVVTTGSRASDLRRGAERLPGRKGKLSRTSFIFTPISFSEFRRVCGHMLGDNTLHAYILSGGSPVACEELAAHGRIPDYVIEMTRDWIFGEFARTGRLRSSLLSVFENLFRFAGTPVGQAKLARESGLANNTVAAGYIELLMDLMCVATSHAWDVSRNRKNFRRPCKFHVTNLLVAVAWHPARIRSVEGFNQLAARERAYLVEWMVAQELWRRSVIRGNELPESMAFWQSKTHEIDFVIDTHDLIEVKNGPSAPTDFAWFSSVFPKKKLTVINQTRFSTKAIIGMTLEDFLTTSQNPD